MYAVIAYRYGMRDDHSYLVTITPVYDQAVIMANEHVTYRGGKYGCEVVDSIGQQLNYFESSYFGCCGRDTDTAPADRKKKGVL